MFVKIRNVYFELANCQAQFQSSPSPVQLELRLALSLIITTHPPRKVEMQLEIGHIWPVDSMEWHCIDI